MKRHLRIAVLAAVLPMGTAFAQTPVDALNSLESAARAANPSFRGFAAERGSAFFQARHGRDWSCASCHTADPRADGRHMVTGNRIEPLAPSPSVKRFTNPAKTEKWFRRNCNDVLGRECTAVEKGNVLAYLLSLRS